MIVIACTDDNMGMMFHHRRQSQDRILRERVLQTAKGGVLWMNHYSAKQFSGNHAPQIHVDDHFLAQAGKGDYCFVEDCDITPYLLKIEQIVLYRWNRRYPADQTFSIHLNEGGWKLVHTEDFPGFSHERITKETYTQ
ncbi:MAG: ribonuclease Z [Oscillospiraceae bacterium]|nr:ribonuclease Z [Oscillospiraceae bacterium]